MDYIPFKKPDGPWYKHFAFWSEWAERYRAAYLEIPGTSPHHHELRALHELAGFRHVYESNLIEGAGLSRDDTKKVIEDYFPRNQDRFEAFRHMHSDTVVLPKSDTKADGVHLGDIVPSFSFGKKSERMRDVVQHYEAYELALQRALELSLTISKPRRIREEEALEVKQEPRTENDHSNNPQYPELLTEELIKNLHKVLADELLPEDDQVRAGEYRIDARTVGNLQVIFPSPELVPDCMRKFVEDSNSLLSSQFTANANIYEIAARITYDFVRIQPFPDFNGRLSRLILLMVLVWSGIPFAVTLGGDKKGRKRYFRSLEWGNKGNIIPYAALIAMRVAETFLEIDENIMRAGHPSMLTFTDKE